MDQDFGKTSNNDTQESERLARLSAPTANTRAYNPKYSKFIRWSRRILPLIALTITAIVFAWSNMSDDNIIPAQSAKAPKTIGKNELLNPRFESMDDKGQPYTITADRASQGETNEDLIMLENPLADILLNNGSWLAIKSKEGGFSQSSQRLLLRGDVELFHDDGYQMQMAELHVDMDKNTAQSNTAVYGQGPAGTLQATGLRADNNKGHLIFTGPAKLTLRHNKSKTSLRGMFDE